MKTIMTLILSVFMVAQSSDPAKIAGDWEGTLSVQGQSLRLVIHIKYADNELSATLDSPDQGANGFKVDTITLKDDKLNFAINQFQGSYEGTLKDGKFEGKWSQGGQTLDLNLAKQKKTGKS